MSCLIVTTTCHHGYFVDAVLASVMVMTLFMIQLLFKSNMATFTPHFHDNYCEKELLGNSFVTGFVSWCHHCFAGLGVAVGRSQLCDCGIKV